jgi:hypothetical protein
METESTMTNNQERSVPLMSSDVGCSLERIQPRRATAVPNSDYDLRLGRKKPVRGQPRSWLPLWLTIALSSQRISTSYIDYGWLMTITTSTTVTVTM